MSKSGVDNGDDVGESKDGVHTELCAAFYMRGRRSGLPKYNGPKLG